MEQFLEILGNIFLVLGSLLTLVSAIGLNRMSDFFTRTHPVGINDSLGMPLILIGVLFKMEPSLLMVKIIFIIAISMITASTASHALTKSAIYDLEPKGQNDKNYIKKLKK